jgi:hypothetical protein
MKLHLTTFLLPSQRLPSLFEDVNNFLPHRDTFLSEREGGAWGLYLGDFWSYTLCIHERQVFNVSLADSTSITNRE